MGTTADAPRTFDLSSLAHNAAIYLQFLLIIGPTLILWEAWVQIFNIQPVVIPAPSFILQTAINEFGRYITQTWHTFVSIVVGYIPGLIFGILSAISIRYIPILRRTFYPLLLLTYLIPKVAFAPLFVIWFGISIWSKAFLVLLIVYFPVLINTLAGLEQEDPELLDLCRSYAGDDRWFLFWNYRVPTAAPFVVTAMKLGGTYAVIGAIVAEFVGSATGIGRLIIRANRNALITEAFTGVLFVAFLGLVVWGSLTLLENRLLFWYEEEEPA